MTYRAGIIGTGGVAGMGILGMHDEEDIGNKKIRASHAGGYRCTDGIELVAVADIDEENVNTFGDAWDIASECRYVDHEQMLKEADLDVVSVCTPTYLHHQHVVDAATISDPEVIWCEKPIASSVSDAEKMIRSCEKADAELVINHSFRFTRKLQRLQELMHSEDILGEIQSASTQFRMELLRNSTHLLDTLLYLLDTRADIVSGHITGENEAVGALDVGQEVTDSGGGGFVVMEDGTFTTIDCTIPREISSMNLQFIGTKGRLSMNNDDGEWTYWRLDDGDHVEEPLPGLDEPWTWERDYRAAFGNAATHIVNLIEEAETNISTGRDSLLSLEMIIGFYLSHYTGSQVSVPLEQPLRDINITSW